MTKVIAAQLERVAEADLSHYDSQTCVYRIPRRTQLKLAVDTTYLIHLKPQAFTNTVVATNWNNGNMPNSEYVKAEVVSLMPGMAKFVGVMQKSADMNSEICGFWSGWFNIHDFEILSKI